MSTRVNSVSALQRILLEHQEALKQPLDGVAALASVRAEIASVAQHAFQEHQEALKRSLDGVASLASARLEIASVAQHAFQERQEALKRSLDGVASLASARLEIASVAQHAFQEHQERQKRLLDGVASMASARLEIASVAQHAFQEHQEALKRSLDGVASLASARTEIASVAQHTFQEHQKRQKRLLDEVASMATQVLEQVNKDALGIDEIADVVQDAIQEESEKLPQEKVSAEWLMSFLFTIILFAINLQSSKEAEERIIKAIEKIEEPLIDFIGEHENTDSNETYFFVNSSVNLRALPNTEASIITVLNPNQRVELIKQQDGWLYIRYFDHLDGVPRIGWVYHRYLSLVQ